MEGNALDPLRRIHRSKPGNNQILQESLNLNSENFLSNVAKEKKKKTQSGKTEAVSNLNSAPHTDQLRCIGSDMITQKCRAVAVNAIL